MSRRGLDTRPKHCGRHSQTEYVNNSQSLFEFQRASKALTLKAFIFPSIKE